MLNRILDRVVGTVIMTAIALCHASGILIMLSSTWYFYPVGKIGWATMTFLLGVSAAWLTTYVGRKVAPRYVRYIAGP